MALIAKIIMLNFSVLTFIYLSIINFMLRSPKRKSALRKSDDIELTNSVVQTNHIIGIIVVGTPDGELENLKDFFKYMPANSGIAFIIITHLEPNHISLLPELLQNYTLMTVTMIAQAIKVAANQIYILPPGKYISICDGVLNLVSAEAQRPVDFFLHSLVQDQSSKGICIILSGNANDSTIGLQLLREKGGLVIAECAKSVQHNGMLKRAISTGLVDYILAPDKMPRILLKYVAQSLNKSILIEDRISDEIQQILLLLYNHTGHDFSLYKPNTICRRIQKRMSIQQLDSLSHYIRYLHQNSKEIEVLFKELLINVTNFFRDPKAFDFLKQELMERILKNKSKDDCLRVWVPGCSTGEETYSIAIVLQECMDTLRRYFNVRIFGTDIDSEAIEFARAGIYPANIVLDVSPERLNRFFTKENNSYKISGDIRKMIIFAEQSITKDPPFTKLDLLSCRNLLIYLSSQLQKKILPLFHYSLKSNGLLFLGSSETIGGSVDLFSILDRRWKVFKHRGGVTSFPVVMDFPSATALSEITEIPTMEKTMQEDEPKLSHLVESILLETYAPACVAIDEKNCIIYVYGRTGKFLEFASGEARLNILDMVRSELKSKLASAIRKANSQQQEVTFTGLQIKEGTEFKYLTLKVKPLVDAEISRKHLLLVIFEDMNAFTTGDPASEKRVSKNELDKKVIQLEEELKYTKGNLQTTIEELETSNEELKSSNEELQSINEELQSTNEEIETSKEELQSLNEELTTVNTELESRIEQLSSTNDDIKNLLDNTEIATIFLDKDLCIKRFTPRATEIINLISADVGRPIAHIVSNLHYEKLVEDARIVLKTLESKTTEVRNKSGHWHVIRIIPYRTVTNVIDGVVVTFLNIHAQKEAEEKLLQLEKNSREIQGLNKLILEMLPHPTLILDGNFNIIGLNHSLNKIFGNEVDKLIGSSIYKLNSQGWDIIKIKHLLEKLLSQQSKIEDYKVGKLSLPTETQLSVTAYKISTSVIMLVLKIDTSKQLALSK